MTVKYKYNCELNLVSVKATDILTSNEILEYFNKLLDDASVQPGFLEVVDLNGVKDFVLRYSDIEKITLVSESIIKKGHMTTLIAAYNDLSKNIASMMIPLLQSVKFNVQFCASKSELESSIELLLAKD